VVGNDEGVQGAFHGAAGARSGVREPDDGGGEGGRRVLADDERRVLALRGGAEVDQIKVSFGVKCGECSKPLPVRRYDVGRAGGHDLAIEVDICEECVQVAAARTLNLREPVLRLAGVMEVRLRANDHKGHWRGRDDAYLMRRLREEAEELFAAVEQGAAVEEIEREAADVANFAMMIADNARHPEGV